MYLLYFSVKLVPFVSIPGLPIFDSLNDDKLKQMIQMNTTTGKPMCGVCKKDFVNRSYTLEHIKSKHVTAELLSCPYCNEKSFRTKTYRNNHIYQQHKELHRMSKFMKQ